MLSALRSRDFLLLWLSQSASVLGDGLVVVAIGLYVTRLTGDPGDVGVVLAAYSLRSCCSCWSAVCSPTGCPGRP